MMLFDNLLRKMDEWLDRLDRERDVAMRMMARRGRTDEIAVWLDKLDVERAKHVELMAELKALDRAEHPALLLGKRPAHMLKARLREVKRIEEKGA